jgi:hypothetical protein
MPGTTGPMLPVIASCVGCLSFAVLMVLFALGPGERPRSSRS